MTIAPIYLTNSKDRYNIKILCHHDGGTGPGDDTLVCLNSVLLAQLIDGPLRELFNVSGLTYDDASVRILSSPRVQFSGWPEVAAGPQWAFDVEVSSEPGRPSLMIMGSPDSPNYVVQIALRHSTGR
jgi:hypothetical protein